MSIPGILRVLILIITSPLTAQEEENVFHVETYIVDAITKAPIPFASLYKTRDNKGTVSKLNGKAVLENVNHLDSLVCFSMGYEKLTFIFDKNHTVDTLYLLKEAKLLDEVTVLADNSFLYKLVNSSAKTQTYSARTAKTYFELESYYNDQQLEFFQGYYNGVYRGYDVSALNMKMGRFTLAPIRKRFFASTETSKVMYMQKTFQHNDYFPTGPLELSKKKLRKEYDLHLVSKYKNDNQQTIYVLAFTPRRNPTERFGGTMWIDSLTAQVLKIQLKIKNTQTHPFSPIWSIHRLNAVDLEVNKTFIPVNGEIYVQSIDLRYNLNYRSERDSNFNVSTRALLYAYNYKTEFVLPFFELSEMSNESFRTVQMLPYNAAFWRCNDEFQIQVNNELKNAFMADKGNVSSEELFTSDTLLSGQFLENPYIRWSTNRIRFREESEDSTRFNLSQGTIPAQRYHLEVQLFMDVNTLCDTLQIITQTIFDPYKSYFKFPTTKESQVFINIYFDLMETERRKLVEELKKCSGDMNQIQATYEQAKKNAAATSKRYFKEVQRGTIPDELRKWNALVDQKLKINNMYLFGLQ